MKIKLLPEAPKFVNLYGESVIKCDKGLLFDFNYLVTLYSLDDAAGKRLYKFGERIVYFESKVSLSSRFNDFKDCVVKEWKSEAEVDISAEAKMAILYSVHESEDLDRVLFYIRNYEGRRKSAYVVVNMKTLALGILRKKLQFSTRLKVGNFFYNYDEKLCSLYNADLSIELWSCELEYDGIYTPKTVNPHKAIEIGNTIVLPICVLGQKHSSFLVLLSSKDGTELNRVYCDYVIHDIFYVDEKVLVLTEDRLLSYPMLANFEVGEPEELFFAGTPAFEWDQLYFNRNLFFVSEDFLFLTFISCQRILCLSINSCEILSQIRCPSGWYPDQFLNTPINYGGSPVILLSRLGGPQFHRAGLAQVSLEDLKTKQTFDVEPEPDYKVWLENPEAPSALQISLTVDTFDNAIRFGEMKAQDLAYEYGHVVPYRTEENPNFNGQVFMTIRSTKAVGEKFAPYIGVMEERFARWAEYQAIRTGDGSQELCRLKVAFEAID